MLQRLGVKMPKKDWREAYVICEHLAKNPNRYLITRHRGFRVCCESCYKEGFLDKDLEKHQEGKLSIGKIKDVQK